MLGYSWYTASSSRLGDRNQLHFAPEVPGVGEIRIKMKIKIRFETPVAIAAGGAAAGGGGEGAGQFVTGDTWEDAVGEDRRKKMSRNAIKINYI